MIVFGEITHEMATDFIQEHHRHAVTLPKVQIRFSVGIMHPQIPGLLGVAQIGNPCGRTNDLSVVEVRRVCFRPGFRFGDLRRYYQLERNEAPSRRRLAVIMHGRDDGPYLFGRWQAILKPYEVPSVFMEYIRLMVRLILPAKSKIWTYTRTNEKGAYLHKSGYRIDKVFSRNGVEKNRYTRSVEGPELSMSDNTSEFINLMRDSFVPKPLRSYDNESKGSIEHLI